MKIAVIAGNELTEEINIKKIPAEVELIWANSLQELVNEADADIYFDLEFLKDSHRIEQLSRLLPKPVFINSVVHTLHEIRQPFIRINAWPGFLKRPVTEIAVLNEDREDMIPKIFEIIQWQSLVVADIPGMISARVIAMIINEAYYTLQDKISTKAEIDIAMKLGTNYPHGPFEWSSLIGLKNIYELLTVLSKTDTRYTASDLLMKEVTIG